MKLCLLPDPGETGRVALICMYHGQKRVGGRLGGWRYPCAISKADILAIGKLSNRIYWLRGFWPVQLGSRFSLSLKRIYYCKSSVGSFTFQLPLVPLWQLQLLKPAISTYSLFGLPPPTPTCSLAFVHTDTHFWLFQYHSHTLCLYYHATSGKEFCVLEFWTLIRKWMECVCVCVFLGTFAHRDVHKSVLGPGRHGIPRMPSNLLLEAWSFFGLDLPSFVWSLPSGLVSQPVSEPRGPAQIRVILVKK